MASLWGKKLRLRGGDICKATELLSSGVSRSAATTPQRVHTQGPSLRPRGPRALVCTCPRPCSSLQRSNLPWHKEEGGRLLRPLAGCPCRLLSCPCPG